MYLLYYTINYEKRTEGILLEDFFIKKNILIAVYLLDNISRCYL